MTDGINMHLKERHVQSKRGLPIKATNRGIIYEKPPMDLTKILRLIGAAVIVTGILLNVTCFFGEFLKYARPNPPGAPDIPAIILSYFTTPAKMTWLWTDLFIGRGLQGSSIYVKYAVAALFGFPAIFLTQVLGKRKWGQRFPTILWANYAYIVAMMLITFYAATVNGIAQAEGWYSIRVYTKEGLETWISGRFDVATHVNTGLIFFGWGFTLAIAQWLKLHNCWGRFSAKIAILIDAGINWIYINFIGVKFEVIEFLNTDRYEPWNNTIGNSYSDLASYSIVAFVIIFFLYWLLVPKEVAGYDTDVALPEHFRWGIRK